MKFSIREQAAKVLSKRKKHSIYVLSVSIAAVFTVVGVVYGLTRPGRAFSSLQKTLECNAQAHTHTAECYDAEGNLICGMADYFAHVHDPELCYDENGDLVCPLPEIIPHEHDDSCYIERLELICGIEEGQVVDRNGNPVFDEAGNPLFDINAVPEIGSIEILGTVEDVTETEVTEETDANQEVTEEGDNLEAAGETSEEAPAADVTEGTTENGDSNAPAPDDTSAEGTPAEGAPAEETGTDETNSQETPAETTTPDIIEETVDLGGAAASLANVGAMAIAVVAVGVMVFIGMRSYGLEVRKQQDQARLNDVKYDEIKGLLAEQLSLRNKMENAQKDIQALPHPNANVGDIMDQVFLQLTDKVEGVKKYKVNSDDNEIETTFYVKVLEDYNNLQEKIRANGFFSIKTSLKSKQAIMKVPIIEGSSEDGSDKDKDDKKSSDTDTEAEKTAETDTDTNTDTEAAETDTEKESDKKKRKKQEYNEVEVYEVTHTFTVEGLNNKTSGSDEEFDGHHTDISHGTNYDEMIESTMED